MAIEFKTGRMLSRPISKRWVILQKRWENFSYLNSAHVLSNAPSRWSPAINPLPSRWRSLIDWETR